MSGPVGRDAEFARLAALLAGAGSGHAAAALVRGEAGSGKTTLLSAVADQARADGWTSLTAKGVESEAALAGAGLLAVLSPLRAYRGSIPSAQAKALDGLLGWGEGASGDPFLVGAATLSLLAEAAAETPLLIAVDDVQWLDPESAHALTFAARRLGHDRVVVVVAQREGIASPAPLDDFDLLPLTGLSPVAARDLLGPGFSADVVDVLVSESRGNPLALLECRRVLTPAQRSGAAPLPPALPVPERLRDAFVERLGNLPPAGWRAVVLCAASSEQESAPVLAALVEEGLDPDTCLREAADVLVLGGGVLGFSHPLLRSASWSRASTAERRTAHLALATVSMDRASRAWHRAEATPGYDDVLADELAAVAEADRERRGYAAAATALERSARLCTDPAIRTDRLALATEDAFFAGDAERVRRLAGDVLARGGEAQTMARVLLALGVLEQHFGTFARSRDLLARASELASGRLLVLALTELFSVCYLLDDIAGLGAAADRAAAVANRTDPEQAMLAAYLQGAARVIEGRPDIGAPLVRQAIDLLESDPLLRDDPRHLLVALMSCRWLMDPSAALGYAERRINRAREIGALGVLVVGLAALAAGLAWLGDHVRAYAYAGEAVDLLAVLGYAADPGVAFEVAAMECSGRGLHDEASRLLDMARQSVAVNAFDPMPPHLAHAVSLCAFSRGDLTEVVDVLEDQVNRFNGVGPYLDPLGVAPLLAEAYLGLGRDADAADLAARYAAAQPGEPTPPVAALVARCEGIVAKDLARAEVAFERALAHHARHPNVFEAARTRLLYGMRLRRAGRRVDAREQLRVARREFASMDLTLWVRRAEQELAGTGERRIPAGRACEPLTSQETRVGLLVAQGLTNKEVAAALFLSPKTIEHHVGSVLRKRGLRSRTELAVELTAEPAPD